MTGIYLDQDQADDLCELLGHIHTVAWWLLFASDQITGDLAQAAYPAHFHPPSAVFWLTEDLIHIGGRLHQAIHPDNDNNDQPSGTNRRNPAPQAGTSSTAPSRDELDNSTPIGNHKPIMIAAAAPLRGPLTCASNPTVTNYSCRNSAAGPQPCPHPRQAVREH
jgi:hypothetical protein